MTFLEVQSSLFLILKGSCGLFKKAKVSVVWIRGQVPHLLVLHLDVPGIVTVSVNLALVRILFRLFGCLLLLMSLYFSLISDMVFPVQFWKRLFNLEKISGLLGFCVVMTGILSFGVPFSWRIFLVGLRALCMLSLMSLTG